MTIDRDRVRASLFERGYALLDGVLDAEDCRALVGMWDDGRRFRSTIVMERHNYGVGTYRYFAYPLPPLVQRLREAFYAELAPIACELHDVLGMPAEFPATLEEQVARCHAAGQTRPTPLILHYTAGGYNCLHNDLYGELVFPLQVTCFLSRPGHDYDGGEFLLVEQRPRAQSRGEVIVAQQGDAVVFATSYRPARSARGYYRARLRHGVSTVRRGERYALGLIFHDAA